MRGLVFHLKKVTDYDDNSVTLVCTLVYTNAIDS